MRTGLTIIIDREETVRLIMMRMFPYKTSKLNPIKLDLNPKDKIRYGPNKFFNNIHIAWQ